MSEFDDLNKVASLQYGTSRREFFVIVIDESIKELEQELEIQNLTDAYPNNIQGHSKLLQQIFEKNYSVTRRSKILDTSINGMPTRTLTVEVNAEGTEVSFSLAYVYGKETLYQIGVWALADRKEKYSEQMTQIIHSLKEL